MASITEHGDGFRAAVKYRGVRRSAVFPTRREATRWAAKVEEQIDAGLFDRKAKHTFSEACDEYLDRVVAKLKKESSRQWYTRRVEEFRSHFGEMPITDIGPQHIAAWRDERLRTVSASTVIRQFTVLRRMLKVARREWRWIETEPHKDVEMPTHGAPRRAMWRWQQIRRVLREGRRSGYKTAQAVQAFHLSLRTAMRLQEVLVAPRAIRGRTVVLQPDQTKTRERRHIPIPAKGLRLLLAQEPFEVGANEASALFSRLLKRLQITGLRFHDARATALTLLARKHDILTLARISGHRDINQLNEYYRESDDDIAKRI